MSDVVDEAGPTGSDGSDATAGPVGRLLQGAALASERPADGVEVSLNVRSVARSTVVVLSLVAAFLLALWLYGVVGHFLFLLLLSWLFAVALEPGIGWFMRHGRSRGAAATLTGAVAVLSVLVLVGLFGDLLAQQVGELVRNLPGAIKSAIEWSNSRLGTNLNPQAIISGLHVDAGQVSGLVGSLSGGLFTVLGSLASVLIDLLTVLVFGFYMAAAGPKFLQPIAVGLRPGAQRVFLTVADITAQKTGGYVASKVALAALSSLFHGILFAAIGVPYWLPFALFVGVTAQFVPLVGTYIGVLLPVLATVVEAPWKAIVIVVFAAIYQQIESYVFTPRISQKTMDVNPAVALAAVFIGAAVWGPIGALVGIPIVAAAVSIADTYSHRYELIPELAARIAGHGTGTAAAP